jgi:hypothetical protein
MNERKRIDFDFEIFGVQMPTFELPPRLAVPSRGFMVIEGINPINDLRKAQPLMPFITQVDLNDKTELRAPGTDTWLEVAQMELTQANILSLANRYGNLNREIRRHCHTPDGEMLSAEPLSHWEYELLDLQKTFRLWQRLIVKRAPVKDTVLAEYADILEGQRADPRILLKPEVIRKINLHLQSVMIQLRPCEVPGCPQAADELHQLKRGIRFYLSLENNSAVTANLGGYSLLSLLWFQFAQHVAGKRKLRICRHCGKWMDTTFERGNPKLYHPRCSATLEKRGQRARQKLNTTKTTKGKK